MQRVIFFAAAAFALAGAGIAIAHGVDAKSVKAVSATLTLGTASNVRTETCTGAAGTFTTVRGRWSGNATGDPTLTGTATLDAEIFYGPTGDGTVNGRLRIDGANHTDAHVDAVVASGGNFAGLAEGHVSAPGSKLLGNFSGNYSSTTGITGKLGGGTAGGNAVLLTEGGCKPVKPPKPETVGANGSLTKNPNGSVTVAGVTCNVPSNLTNDVAKFNTGDRVEIKCTTSGGVNTLTRINGHHGDHD